MNSNNNNTFPIEVTALHNITTTAITAMADNLSPRVYNNIYDILIHNYYYNGPELAKISITIIINYYS